jgi:hypothetical protein
LQNTVAGSLRKIVPLDDREFYVEMENTRTENIQELIRQWHTKEDIIYVSPVYLDEYGEDTGWYTNEVVAKLKSKDDYSVLQKNAAAYHITEIRPDEFEELKYILTLPLQSQKNALEIANELHETVFFEFAMPYLNFFGKLGIPPSSNETIWELPDENSPFKVYPNPVKDVLYIDIDRQALDNPACKIHIYSLTGSKALQTATNGNEVKINVSVLQNGIYFLHLYDISNSKQETRKIMIKH